MFNQIHIGLFRIIQKLRTSAEQKQIRYGMTGVQFQKSSDL